jgi:streptomycin 6-kinase
MVGDAAFDWAFWVVYYDLSTDLIQRLRLAADLSGIAATDVLNLCLTLCVDGLLYYREVGDPRASRMLDVMTSLVARIEAGAPC